MRALRAPALVLTAASCLGAFVAATLVARPVAGLPGDPFWLVWSGFPVVGAFILVKRPGNIVGLIQVLIGVCGAVSAIATVLYEWGVEPAAPLVLNQLFFTPIFVLVPLLILFFPSGRLPSPRWRPLVIVATVCGLLLGLWYVLRPVASSLDGEHFYANPLGIEGLRPFDGMVMTSLAVILSGFAVAALVQAIVAYRRANATGRLQVKWVVVPALFMSLLYIAGILLEEVGGTALSNIVSMSAILIGGNGIAVGIGVAVFRHNLYGIDKIVSRTVSYSLLLVLLGVTFFGVVTGLTALLSPDDPLVVAVATLAVAASFDPVRRRVHRMVDRRFNRSVYDSELLMGEFSESLRERLDIDEVVEGWVLVVAKSMQPTTVGVWVRS